jgi:hypothetical protein
MQRTTGFLFFSLLLSRRFKKKPARAGREKGTVVAKSVGSFRGRLDLRFRIGVGPPVEGSLPSLGRRE